MSQIKRFTFSNNTQITAQIADNINNFLWTAHAKNSAGNCVIKKTSKFSPNQVYFSLNKQVNQIVAFDLNASTLFVAYNDTELLGESISKTNPLTSTIEIDKGSYLESPIDVKINGTDVWFLMPGEISGSNAKLLRYNTSAVFQQEVNLIKSGQVVNFARTMTIDENGDIWIGTYTNPASIVRVYDTGGSIYDFDITEII